MALLGAIVGAPGCGCNPLAALLVSAPNRFNPLAGPKNPLPPIESLLADEHVWVRVGPPQAWLSVSILDPHDRAPRGTVFVLHGIAARGCTMYSTARDLNKAGFRAVLVDLRGQGRSTGQYITYGIREAQDLVQVLDEFERRGKVAGKVGVYGISYGATTSIHWAAIDRRVEAVVAVEPFAMLRPEVPHFARTMFPGVGWCIPEACYQKAITEAGEIAGFDPDRADAADAIASVSGPVLLFHGTDDWVVPYWNSLVLQQASPDYVRRVSIEGGGHASLWWDGDARISKTSVAWFRRLLMEQ
jgi:pimeloyl-ACP methyl ester carboxylesterase